MIGVSGSEALDPRFLVRVDLATLGYQNGPLPGCRGCFVRQLLHEFANLAVCDRPSGPPSAQKDRPRAGRHQPAKREEDLLAGIVGPDIFEAVFGRRVEPGQDERLRVSRRQFEPIGERRPMSNT